ncbi:hypothetical protein PGT21_027840 [Puccinia graminis f. sp. tritici]|uniref:Uncharacterized protein n=1 Tax=Puccinia graminis f. sp. tritici TaxID=56615 RepID=A0A5B0M196_PUCGR|nr:hypothetical protein PGT21_027840 [Puccinia graminis f. sp. tritici]
MTPAHPAATRPALAKNCFSIVWRYGVNRVIIWFRLLLNPDVCQLYVFRKRFSQGLHVSIGTPMDN